MIHGSVLAPGCIGLAKLCILPPSHKQPPIQLCVTSGTTIATRNDIGSAQLGLPIVIVVRSSCLIWLIPDTTDIYDLTPKEYQPSLADVPSGTTGCWFSQDLKTHYQFVHIVLQLVKNTCMKDCFQMCVTQLY